MGSQDQHRTADLYTAISDRYVQRQAAADAATAPEREARDAALDRDAALWGTPAWDTLPATRKTRVGQHVAAQRAEAGGPDAA
ncbi:hypothetical protein [Streptomyces sp. H27-S2]|uniref:hypothetical protein n=1 Tax=Streptomyces antarcticus TaxID=2996458 RepID=UPI002271EC7D|nr:hypothetical protein [Streptomyces sp. H27-S2]MCY0952094.1 hypothetical protein [Streptomyces sp. H27-S2]